MALAAGERLGPYQVLGLIGAGGMGEVYRAKDTRLGRTVAIKILPADISSDPDRRARFEREARTIATLSHPHICTLYDVGEHASSLFLVMEHLEGQTLAERLRKGGLPFEQALEIGAQIAEALNAAHRAGIIHRDLKPANVILTKSGVKLLDFGLAKLRARAGEPAAVSAMTNTQSLTGEGTIVGTLQYMAPEQLEGKDVDARTDIWALGVVLYEMITGEPAFRGGSPASIIASILGDERPSLLLRRSDVPPAVERLVFTCLARDPMERWQSPHDVALHLAAPLASTPARSAGGRHRTTWAVAAAFSVGLIVGTVGGYGWWQRSARSPLLASTHLTIPLPSGTRLAANPFPAGGASVAISSDGRTVAFVTTGNGERKLSIRSLANGHVKILAGTEGATSPFFSPDGHWVGFFARTELKKVSVDDGTLLTVCETPPVARGGVWGPNGVIYFSPDFSRGIQRVSAAGGVFQEVTHVQFDAGESNHLLPEILPGGEILLFTVWKGGSFRDATIWSLSLRSGDRKRLLDSATAPHYIPPGYLTFVREGVLFAAPFDPLRATVAGEAFPVVDGVWTDPSTGSAQYAVAADGTLVFAAGKNTVERRRLVWVDREGHLTPTRAEPNAYGGIRLSPDGQRVAMELLNDIWVYDFKTGAMSRATYRSVNQTPVWAPDGRHIAISSSQGVLLPTLFWIASEGGQPAIRLSDEGDVQFPASWTPDGRRLAYNGQRERSETGWDIRVLDLDARPAHRPVVATSFTEESPMLSPDGGMLAYESDETGRRQVYLRPFPGEGARIQVSTDGGAEPVWSRNTNELFFRNGRQMLAVRVQTRGQLAIGPPVVLFEGDFADSTHVPDSPSYDVAPDGRFLMIAGSENERPLPQQLEIVLNWAAELDRARPRTP